MRQWNLPRRIANQLFRVSGTALTVHGSRAVVPAAAPAGTPEQHGLYRGNVVKGVVRFNGTATTLTAVTSFNVTSLTDNGTGDYTITWDRDFANANYVMVGTAAGLGRMVNIATATGVAAGSARIRVANDAGVAEDNAVVCVIAMGDQ